MAGGFYADLKRGQMYEQKIDRHFRETFGLGITEVNMVLQRAGIDRIWVNRDFVARAVEYKADEKAAETGNAFIEVISNDKTGREGWALTSYAEHLCYLDVGNARAYFCDMKRIKQLAAGKWMRTARRGKCNDGYKNAIGLLIPLSQLVRDTEAKIYGVNLCQELEQ